MSELASLLVEVPPLSIAHTVGDVGELLLRKDYRRFLCLPIVDEGRPVGTVSRDELQSIYMMMYGRELHGRKSVATVMNPSPLVVDVGQSLDEASQYITSNIHFPITEDFVITRDGQYLGLGHVVDLLRVMQERLGRHNQELDLAYRKLKASEAQLVQSEKMASLGQMVAGVAHEINTPLGYVKNNVGLARDILGQTRTLLKAYDNMMDRLTSGQADENELGVSLGAIGDLREVFNASFAPEDVENLFDDTLYGVAQISEIVLNLRDFSRLDKAAVDNVNLNQCLDSALLIARNVTKHKAEVIKEYAALPLVSCTPSQINQVLLNLLTNAAQAIENHGRIVVKTWADTDYANITVQDTGKGIAPEHLDKIFDPFFTTKPVGEGTGLGLSIAFQIMRSHGGQLRVESQIGLGTVFTVSLSLKRTVISA